LSLKMILPFLLLTIPETAFQKRGFTCSICPDYRNYLTFVNCYVHAFQGMDAPVVNMEGLRL